MRNTSLLAYQHILQSGILGDRQRQAFEAYVNFGPMSGQDLTEKTGVPGMWKRCSELEAIGVIVPVGEKICEETHQTVTVWDVTPKDFTDAEIEAILEKRKQEKQEQKNKVNGLEAEVALLRAQVQRLERENEWLKSGGAKPMPAAAEASPSPVSGEERFELFVKGKPGLTVGSLERAKSAEVVEFYCDAMNTTVLQVKFRRLVLVPA